MVYDHAGQGGSNKKYRPDACRMRAYRKRKGNPMTDRHSPDAWCHASVARMPTIRIVEAARPNCNPICNPNQTALIRQRPPQQTPAAECRNPGAGWGAAPGLGLESKLAMASRIKLSLASLAFAASLRRRSRQTARIGASLRHMRAHSC